MKIAMTINDVSEMLGLSTDSVYKLVRENKIPSVRAGRRILFYKPVILEWLSGSKGA